MFKSAYKHSKLSNWSYTSIASRARNGNDSRFATCTRVHRTAARRYRTAAAIGNVPTRRAFPPFTPIVFHPRERVIERCFAMNSRRIPACPVLLRYLLFFAR